jgi:predicted phage terminase large subunit-like protein
VPAVLTEYSPQRRLEAYLRNRYDAFLRKAFHTVSPGADLKWNWHIGLMAEYMEACRRREITRLVINIPPRTLKSICTTMAWPAFLLGKNPSCQIIAAGYSSGLSIQHSVDTRLLLDSEWYRRIFPEVQLVKDQNTKTRFNTTARGHRIATSVGGTATSFGGDYLIVDDPVDPMKALSEVERTTANTWFDQTFSSRLNDPETGVIVIVMQRLHMEDLTGHVLKKGGWEHLCVPLIAPENKLYGFGRVRKEVRKDECLHSERFTPKVVEEIKRERGSYAFAAQYLQAPTPLEGGFIKKAWLERYRTLPANPKLIVQGWDTAMKADELYDPSGCQTFYVTDRSYYVADYYSERLEYPDLKRAVISQAAKWKPHAILIEDKGSGESLIQDLSRKTQLPVIPCVPESDKITRLAAQAAKVEAGLLFLPENAQMSSPSTPTTSTPSSSITATSPRSIPPSPRLPRPWAACPTLSRTKVRKSWSPLILF